MIFNVLFFNMFVGIVIEVYKGEMDKNSNNLVLSREQRIWANVQKVGYSVKPIPFLNREKLEIGKAQKCFQKLVLSKKFEYFIVAGIMANTIVLALHWFY